MDDEDWFVADWFVAVDSDSDSAGTGTWTWRRRKQRARKAFIEALESGRNKSHRARLMIVGAARAGKTSLLRRLTEKSFNPDEKSTKGVEQSDVYIQDAMSWELIDESTALDSVHAEVSRQIRSRRHLLASGSGNAVHDTRTDDPQALQAPSNVFENVGLHTKLLYTDVGKHMLSKSHKNKPEQMRYSLWDFGGQSIYRTTHPIFLSWRAVYIVVFDLSLKLRSNQSAEGSIAVSQYTSTYLQELDSWMMSIYVHAVRQSKKSTRDDPKESTRDDPKESTRDDPKESTRDDPKIILVGTHRDMVTPQQITEQMNCVKELVKDRPYRHQVIDKTFTVDNTQEDGEIARLKEEIDKVMRDAPFMGVEMPTRWLQFEDYVFRQVGQNVHSMTLVQVNHILDELNIKSEDEKDAVLQLYHHFGRVVYYTGIDLVILEPRWLNDVLKKIIAVIDQTERDKLPASWDRLEHEGVLEERLIDNVWHEFLEKKDALLHIMERFDLLCEVQRGNGGQKQDGTTQQQRIFFVPSLVKESMTERETIKSCRKVGFIVAFKPFLSVGFVHRLYVRIAHWTMKQGGEPPIFHFRQMSFCVDDKHQVVLEWNRDKDQIQVTVHLVDSVELNQECVSQPGKLSADVVERFQQVLQETSEDLKNDWARRISFSIGIVCPVCSKYNDEVVLPLSQFLEKSTDTVYCKRCTNRISKRKIHDSLEHPVSSTTTAAAGRSSSESGDSITDREILRIARQIQRDELMDLGVELGVKLSVIHNVLDSSQQNIRSAAEKVLMMWKANCTDLQRVQLVSAMERAGLSQMTKGLSDPEPQ